MSNDTDKLACDKDGWQYARDAQDFLEESTTSLKVSSNNNNDDEKKLVVRRRKWVRRRILQDYPYASEKTKEYLKMMAENARLSVTVNKISDQLVETKLALTETEEELARTKADLANKDALLHAMGIKDEQVAIVHTGGDSMPEAKTKTFQEFLSKSEQVQEFGSKISQWVHSARKMSDDSGQAEKDAASATAAISEGANGDKKKPEESTIFDWKKIGRGGLMERIKASQSATQKEPPPATIATVEEEQVEATFTSVEAQDQS